MQGDYQVLGQNDDWDQYGPIGELSAALQPHDERDAGVRYTLENGRYLIKMQQSINHTTGVTGNSMGELRVDFVDAVPPPAPAQCDDPQYPDACRNQLDPKGCVICMRAHCPTLAADNQAMSEMCSR
jgi:hypothetical protein